MYSMMNPSSDRFSERLSLFAQYLRAQGFEVGMKKMQDSYRALAITGFEDREVVKTALCALLAGSRREQEVFSQCFDRFFVDEAQFQKNIEDDRAAQAAAEEARIRAEEELTFNGRPIDLREDLKEVYARLSEEQKEQLRKQAKKYEDADRRSPKLYDGFIRSIFMKSLMDIQMMQEDAAEGSAGLNSDADLLMRDISRFRPEEIPRAYALVDQLTRSVNGAVNARRKSSGVGETVDFRRTIRAGISAGGSLHRICKRRRSSRKKRVVMLCDVSASMLQFSEFAIRFMKSMTEISERSDVFLFSEQVQQVSPFALEDMSGFGKYVRRSRAWGKGTNIGRALNYLNALTPPILSPSTVLLILSDAKTVDINRAYAELERANHKAGSVVWLNPIPKDKWKYLSNVQTMSGLCKMLPCSTLHELARACESLSNS